METARILDFDVSEDILSLGFDVATTAVEQFDAFLMGATQVNQNVQWSDGSVTITLQRASVEDLTLHNFVDTAEFVVGTY